MVSADITDGAPKRFVTKSYRRAEPQWDEQFELEVCSRSEISFKLIEGRTGTIGHGKMTDFVDNMREEWSNLNCKNPDIPMSRQIEYY